MSAYAGFNTLEHQIALYNAWEDEKAEEEEERQQTLINLGYVLIPGGNEADTGWYNNADDLSDTGDYRTLDQFDTCSHGLCECIDGNAHCALYHLNEDSGEWELCSDDVDYEDNVNNPRIPRTQPAFLD